MTRLFSQVFIERLRLVYAETCIAGLEGQAESEGHAGISDSHGSDGSERLEVSAGRIRNLKTPIATRD